MKNIRFIFLALICVISIATTHAQGPCKLIIDHPENISEITYNGASMTVQAENSLAVSWSGARQLHVVPAQGCKIDNVVFDNTTWGTQENLAVNEDGTFDQKIDYNHAYSSIAIYTSKTDIAEPTYPLTFVLDDGGFNAISSIKINGVAAEAGWEAGLNVKEGANVSLTVNTTDYKIDVFEINGEAASSYDFTVTQETELTLKAHLYGKVGATLIADNTAAITLYEGKTIYDRKKIDITDGIFRFEVDEKKPFIIIEQTPDYRILSVKDGNGNELTPESIEVYADMVINITTEAIVRDLQATLFVHGLDTTSENSFIGASGHVFDLTEGYQTVTFAKEDLPIELYTRAEFEDVTKVLVNGEEHKGTFFNWRHKLDLEAGDLVLAFVNGVDEPHKVTVSGSTSNPYTVSRHMGDPVEDFSSFEMYYGTTVAIHPGLEENIIVRTSVTVLEYEDSVESDIEADSDGVFRIRILGPTDIFVSDAISSSVDKIAESTKPATYYDMQGIQLTKAPQQGLYIEVRGAEARKVMIR